MTRKKTGESRNENPARKKPSTSVPSTESNGKVSTGEIKVKAPAKSPAKIASAIDLPEETPSYLWAGRVPFGAVTLLAGDQASGKSTLCGMLAGAVTMGLALPGGPINPPRGVLWLSAEESLTENVLPRLRTARADLKRVHFPEILVSGLKRRLGLPKHAGEIKRIAQDLDAGLIVFDPITSHVESGMRAETGAVAREVLEALSEVCQEAHCAAVAIKHPRKGAYGQLIERVSGSREWIQVPRTVLYLASPDPFSPRRVLACLKPGPPQRPPSVALQLRVVGGSACFDWLGIAPEQVSDLERDELAPGERDALRDAKLFLQTTLSDGERRITDLEQEADKAGISRGTLRRAKDSLGVETSHQGGGSDGFWLWSLPLPDSEY